MIDVGSVRETLTNELKDIKGSVAVATSGGIDSSVLIMSCLDIGIKPYVLSFKLDNKDSSYDFDSAKKLAQKFQLEFVPVLLPTEPKIILQKVIYEIQQFGLQKKTSIECVYPMLFIFDTCEQLGIENLICGHAADGHYGLSKKAMIHYRSTKELYQQFRQAYFKNKNVAQSETLKQIAEQKNINLYLPYMQKTYFDLFNNLSWFEVNTPRQKELIRRDYPELDDMKLKNHLNLQLGDSCIAETIGAAVLSLVAPKAKSPVTAYNILWKQYGNNIQKPTYRLPSVREVGKVRGTNGFNVFSLFSGCGGSCLGFEMAGYNILGASEFVAEARNTYKLNHKGTPVDGRDVRDLTAADIFKIAGTSDIDILEGSPPCNSFSVAGKRDKNWGKVKNYSDTVQRSDDLFFEFARLVKEVQPKVFVAENVKGLVLGSSKGYFKLILKELKDCGYVVEARVIDSSYLGVPQARQRTIFVGVRNDMLRTPKFPKPVNYRYSLGDVLVDNPSMVDPETGENISFAKQAIYKEWLKLSPGEGSQKYFSLVRPALDRPIPTLTATGGNIGAASVTHPMYARKLNLEELRLLGSFPKDFKLTGTYKQRYERIGRAVPPLMMKAIAQTILDEILT